MVKRRFFLLSVADSISSFFLSSQFCFALLCFRWCLTCFFFCVWLKYSCRYIIRRVNLTPKSTSKRRRWREKNHTRKSEKSFSALWKNKYGFALSCYVLCVAFLLGNWADFDCECDYELNTVCARCAAIYLPNVYYVWKTKYSKISQYFFFFVAVDASKHISHS